MSPSVPGGLSAPEISPHLKNNLEQFFFRAISLSSPVRMKSLTPEEKNGASDALCKVNSNEVKVGRSLLEERGQQRGEWHGKWRELHMPPPPQFSERYSTQEFLTLAQQLFNDSGHGKHTRKSTPEKVVSWSVDQRQQRNWLQASASLRKPLFPRHY